MSFYDLQRRLENLEEATDSIEHTIETIEETTETLEEKAVKLEEKAVKLEEKAETIRKASWSQKEEVIAALNVVLNWLLLVGAVLAGLTLYVVAHTS